MAYIDGGVSVPAGGSIWDWFTQPPADYPTMQNSQYRLPQIDIGMTGGAPIDQTDGSAPAGPFPNPVSPAMPLPVQKPPMRASALPPFVHPVTQILTDPEGVATKAAKAGIKPPAGGALAASPELADWSAELMGGSPPAGAKDGGSASLAKGFGAITGQESGAAQRPSGSANVSVGTESPGHIAAKNDALNYLLSLMMAGGGGKSGNLRDMIGSR